MSNSHGESTRLVSRVQSAFGTAEAAEEGGFRLLPYHEYTPVPSEDLGRDDAIRGDRHPGDIVAGLVNLAGNIVVPMGLQSIGWHLQMLFGDPVTTGAASDYVHTFRPAANPSPRLQTIGKAHRDIGLQYAHDSLLYTGFEVSAKKDNQRARMTFPIIGREETKLGAELDTTPVEYANDSVPVNFTGSVLVDGAQAAAITEFSGKVANGAEPDQEEMNGAATASLMDLGDWMGDGSIGTRFRDATFLDLAANGTLIDLALEYAITPARGITLRYNNVRLERTGVGISGRGASSASFNWQVGRPETGTFPFEVELRNDVAAYANPT